MLIGELSQRSGIPAKTLRFYEEAGVLSPPPRTPGGYRDYGEDTLDRLVFVRSAQAAGLSLAEIRSVIAIRDGGTPPCTHVRQLLDDKAAALRRQLAQLRALERELNRLRDRAASIDPVACDPRRVCDVLVEPG